MKRLSDARVIGGGIIGLASAYYLAMNVKSRWLAGFLSVITYF
ncbi:MAG: FAD-dependent oxidoreductase [Desulfobacterales bacterium]|jgi:L-2-hydroxyglutarate oxidase LhgO